MPESGQSVGEYVLEERLGSGGFSEVWAGRHVETDEQVALKFPSSSEAVPLLRQEAQLLQQLDHPNIVKPGATAPEELGLDEPLVLKTVSSFTLRDLLNAESPLEFPIANRIFTGIISGLAHAHDRGIAHRDLKPENILLSDEMQPILTDFGLGDTVEGRDTLALSGTFETKIRGTVAYMAPEQHRGKKGDERSDVYTAGLILFEMLRGHLPEPGDHLRQETDSIIDRQLATVFEGCFCQRAERFASASRLLEALETPPSRKEPTSDPDIAKTRGYDDAENMRRFRGRNRTHARAVLAVIGLVVGPIIALQLGLVGDWWPVGAKLIGALIYFVAFLVSLFFVVYTLPRCPNCRKLAGKDRVCVFCRVRLR